MSDIEKGIKSNPYLMTYELYSTAFKEARQILLRGNWVIVKKEKNRLVIDYGTVHTNGEHETAIATVTYEQQGNSIVRNKMVHS